MEALRGRMKPGEAEACAEIREKLVAATDEPVDEVTCLRALRFSGGAAGKATTLLTDYKKWVKDTGVKELCRKEWWGVQAAALSSSSSSSSSSSDEEAKDAAGEGEDTSWMNDELKMLACDAGYFQYFHPGHCKRGCPIKVQANFRFKLLPAMQEKGGLTPEQILKYHVSQMEAHRYLLTLDQVNKG